MLVIYGPRRIGKTTLLRKFLENKENYLSVSGEDLDVQHYLASQSIEKLKLFAGNHTLLVIDEAQVIPGIGLNLKLLVDHCPGLNIIATGSSAFDLANHVGEPLTGRKITLRMFPLSQMEIGRTENLAQTRANLEERLVYGSYPEVILQNDVRRKADYLRELVSAYLYKDILALENIKNQKIDTNNYFWRTYDQQEIDWIEERNGELNAFEFKWNPSQKVKAPMAWRTSYVDSHFDVIHRDDYLGFIV